MLGSTTDTTLFGGRPPIGTNGPLDKQPAYSETGGAWLNVRRETDNTNFVTLHQPFEQGKVPTTTFERLADTSTGDNQVMAVAVRGTGGVDNTSFDDRVMLATGPDIAAERVVTSGKESYRFIGQLWLRITADNIIVVGHPREISLPVSGSPKLIINGQEVAQATNGMMSWQGQTEEPDYAIKPKETSWSSDVDRLMHLLSDPNTGTRENALDSISANGSSSRKSYPRNCQRYHRIQRSWQ